MFIFNLIKNHPILSSLDNLLLHRNKKCQYNINMNFPSDDIDEYINFLDVYVYPYMHTASDVLWYLNNFQKNYSFDTDFVLDLNRVKKLLDNNNDSNKACFRLSRILNIPTYKLYDTDFIIRIFQNDPISMFYKFTLIKHREHDERMSEYYPYFLKLSMEYDDINNFVADFCFYIFAYLNSIINIKVADIKFGNQLIDNINSRTNNTVNFSKYEWYKKWIIINKELYA